MCGVFGYVGESIDVGAAVVRALKTLEYRGYDSWGVAIAASDSLLLDKEIGRINGHHRSYPMAALGLGHTRWATHGGVTGANAHPHVDCTGRIAVVHNGIIENHAELRAELVSRGHRFRSETDSEVVSHLVEDRLANGESLETAVATVFDALAGYNAIVVLDRLEQALAAAKRVSPLVIGLHEGRTTIASDAIALHDHADELIYLDDDHLAILTADRVQVLNRGTMRSVSPPTCTHDPSPGGIALGQFPDFLSKEVHEQPDVLRRLVVEGKDEIAAHAAQIRSAKKVVLIGCGTSGNAALAGTYLLSQISQRDATFVPASEFRYRAGPLNENSLVIAFSQSGETVDVLDALSEAKRCGAHIAAVVNTRNSTLDRIASTSVYLRAGSEQCVLATKSYTAMLSVLVLAAHAVADNWTAGAAAVMSASDAIEHTLKPTARDHIASIASSLAESRHLFVIGRGVHVASALEAALKIKEVSYIHAEGFAAGELKHGVIALIEPGTPCLVFAPADETRGDVLSGASELRSRGATTIGVGSQNDAVFDKFIAIPDVRIANPIVEAVPGQLLGYGAAITLGLDPDRPRNLAKSVTVK